jgi:hypothetical protein
MTIGAQRRTNPVFIIGNGRSGTTLIGEILTELGIGKSFESQFLVDVFGSYGSKALPPETVASLYRKVMRHQSAQRFAIRRELFSVDSPVSAAQLVDSIFTSIARDAGLKRWIDKTPFYIFHIEKLLKIFPDAKFIWCVRDGRDVGLSVLKKSWGPNNIYSAAVAWTQANCNNPGLRLLQESNLIRIKYEDLLRNPRDYITRIVSFIGECVSVDQVSLATQHVRPLNYDKWKSDLTTKEIHVYESVAFECLQTFGYQTSFSIKPRITPFEEKLYRIDDQARRLVHLISLNLVSPVKILLGMQAPFDDRG